MSRAWRSSGSIVWLGLWQGSISPITFLISLFTSEVNIYEVQNNGNWYDFGFMLGVSMAFGGGGSVGKSWRRTDFHMRRTKRGPARRAVLSIPFNPGR